jgi:2-succinyl-5-enolpyruvyl-6-hydroxy-3-cyclohexene-1-carboxylate synthase
VSSATDTYVLLRAFVDELARCGMRSACTAPGSRCAPLIVSLAREPRLTSYSHVDERCAGFFALGLAKATGRPVAVVCTSGTAAGELHPAVIEAHEARVPLIVLSADRPAELRDVGAGQTIDQLKLYGSAAKWFVEVRVEDAAPSRLRWIRTLACRAYATACEGRPGPVHLNFPLREPLVADPELPADDTARPEGRPYVERPPARLTDRQSRDTLEDLVTHAHRGIVVAGRYERDAREGPRRSAAHGAQTRGVADTAAVFCSALGWPLLAEPLSGARRGEAAIAHYDPMLHEGGFRESVRPDFVLRVGDLPTSKPLREWLAGLGDVPQIVLDPEGAWQDPDGVLGASLPLEPARALASLAERHDVLGPAPAEWLASWRSADERAAEAILGVLGDEELSEPLVARELGVLLPDTATLFVASSMPVRDVEAFWPVRTNPPRVLCNRGANGIDGTVSSAFGAAAAAALADVPGPAVLLTGDVALAHDIGGLLAARRLSLKLTIVLLENSGGGIFDFLPVSQAAIARDAYTEHIATPPGLDFAHAATLYGLAHERPESVPQLREALERAIAEERSAIVEVVTERAANVALHERVWEAVGGAVGGA